MKARVLTGVFGGAFAISALIFFPVWAIQLVLAVLCVIGMYELIGACHCKQPVVVIVSLLFAAAIPFLNWMEGFRLLVPVCALFITIVCLLQVLCHKTIRIDQTALLIMGALTIVLPIGMLSYIFAMPDHGRAYVFLTLIIAWFSDMGAFFAGKFFGRHKLCETVSPKKTVEGFFGGIVISVLFSCFGAWIYQTAVLGNGGHVVYWQIALISLVVAPLSVVGDLFCSIIKRHYQLKDFGNLLPGHGGVLDRFDSVIFVAPLMYLSLMYVPLIH